MIFPDRETLLETVETTVQGTGRATIGIDMSTETGRKKPNPIDVHVGSRVRLRRMLVGLSQEKLGESMGLTFQQIQKYEKGMNRIGASRLFRLSEVLAVPVQFFFEGMPDREAHASPGMSEANTESFLYEFLNTREGLELNRAFIKVTEADQRRAVIDLVRALGRASTEK